MSMEQQKKSMPTKTADLLSSFEVEVDAVREQGEQMKDRSLLIFLSLILDQL